MSELPAPPRGLCLVATEPGEGFVVRWRSCTRALAAHPPVLVSVWLRGVACDSLDASELECVVIDRPFSANEHELLPNGVLRATFPEAELPDLAPGPDQALACRIVFAAPDGEVCVEGEDFEVLRAVTLRAELALDADLPDEA